MMNLNSLTLRAIADVVDALEKFPVGQVHEVTVHGHIIELSYEDSQRDGASYTVVGIHKGRHETSK